MYHTLAIDSVACCRVYSIVAFVMVILESRCYTVTNYPPEPPFPSVTPSDCGELYLHSEEPVVSPGVGAAADPTDRRPGAGRLTGQRVAQ